MRWRTACNVAHLALLCNVGQVVAEAAQQAPVALVAQVVKADALLLAVELHDGRDVVGELALVAACAEALCEVKADLGVTAVAGAAPGGVLRDTILHRPTQAHTHTKQSAIGINDREAMMLVGCV